MQGKPKTKIDQLYDDWRHELKNDKESRHETTPCLAKKMNTLEIDSQEKFDDIDIQLDLYHDDTIFDEYFGRRKRLANHFWKPGRSDSIFDIRE